MFSSLSYKRKKNKNLHSDAQDRIANGIVLKCMRIQSKWADYLQGKTERLSSRVKKYGLIGFCVLFGGFSLYLTINGFNKRSSKKFSVAPIIVPEHTGKAGEQNTRATIIITKKEFQKIERFRHYMDSLGQSVAGREVRNSILRFRPGLMDSIRLIQNLYQLQTSNK